LSMGCDAVTAKQSGISASERVDPYIYIGRKRFWIEMRIQDNGCGIPEEYRGRIFETVSFTTKDVWPRYRTGIVHGIFQINRATAFWRNRLLRLKREKETTFFRPDFPWTE